MSQLTTASVKPQDAGHDKAYTAKIDAPQRETVLITEQEVLFGTRAAIAPRKSSALHRFADAVRGVAGSLHLPPPHPHYPADMGYLEQSRMAREMDRL